MERRNNNRKLKTSCSQRKMLKIEIPFLPEEIIFHILIRLSALFLYNIGRYVCKAWANIIRDPLFINAHLHLSESSLFIQNCGMHYHAYILEMEDKECKATHLNHFPPGHMVKSCEGISLFYCRSSSCSGYYVGNPVTMQYNKLPYPHVAVGDHLGLCHIACIPQTGEYKVLWLCHSLNQTYSWHVMTVGINMAWKKSDTTFSVDGFVLVGDVSASVGGVIYLSKGSRSIIAIDMSDETCHCIQVPNGLVKKSYGLLKMGNDLSYIVNRGATIHVCILKDLRRGEWNRVYKFEEKIGRQKCHRPIFYPIVWLDRGQILVFQISKLDSLDNQVFLAYNVKTRERRVLTDDKLVFSRLVTVHTNSLISW